MDRFSARTPDGRQPTGLYSVIEQRLTDDATGEVVRRISVEPSEAGMRKGAALGASLGALVGACLQRVAPESRAAAYAPAVGLVIGGVLGLVLGRADEAA